MSANGTSGSSPQLLRIKAVAERLACSVRTVWALIAAGQLRAVRLSPRATRVEEAELARFIERAKSRPFA